MKLNKRHWITIAAVTSATLVGVGYWVGSARADIPTADVLAYSGFLMDGSNSPVNGTLNIGVGIYDELLGANVLANCDYGPMNTAVEDGHFSVPFDNACVASIEGNGDAQLFVQVSVGGEVLLPRTPLGAVPFAIEAKNATNASNAAPGSALETMLTDLRNDVDDALVDDQGAVDYSLNGRFCGATGTAHDGALGGYAGAKTECASADGCNSPTAHMCTTDELVRTVATGGTVPNVQLRFAAGESGAPGGTNRTVLDCLGYTDNGPADHRGAVWLDTVPVAARDCGALIPIACCD